MKILVSASHTVSFVSIWSSVMEQKIGLIVGFKRVDVLGWAKA